MSDSHLLSPRLALSYRHLFLFSDANGDDRVLYLGYALPLSKSEELLLKTVLLSLPDRLSSNQIAEAMGISPGQISVLVNRINRKAYAIGGRRLILGTSHHGFQLNEHM